MQHLQVKPRQLPVGPHRVSEDEVVKLEHVQETEQFREVRMLFLRVRVRVRVKG